ncbi:hypothetical protein Nepgr_028247 [Nepenthes gracilis]|uniref:Uncharacterized protein n=1 Tax=Nepenthes gracilis TaxID=150966 RepID=A0AAD3TCG9_NEPGR|nr:hypothetical protein Nepgr_028247 [Nepenthes gracilis]
MERCLVTTSLAILLCHPSTTIKCFNPKPRRPPQPRRKKPPPPPQPAPGPRPPQRPTNTERKRRLHKKSPSPVYFQRSITAYSETGPRLRLVSRLSFAFGVIESVLLRRGWDRCSRMAIAEILKVDSGDGVLRKFEEFREAVKAGASRADRGSWGKERAMVDGNEILCFHGASVTCGLGSDGGQRICEERSCGVCRLIRTACCSPLDGVGPTVMSLNSCGAHKKAVKRCGDGGSRKAIVICRGIAGCVARFKRSDAFECGEAAAAVDSVLLCDDGRSDDDQELLMFNPSAVLPCFVVVYNVW